MPAAAQIGERLGKRDLLAVFEVLRTVGDDLLASFDAAGDRDTLAFDECDLDVAAACLVLVEHEQARRAAVAFDNRADRHIDA